MTILIAAVLNILNYGLAYIITPNINIFFLLILLIIIPDFYNVVLYKRGSSRKRILLLPLMTTTAYAIAGGFIEHSGKWGALME